VLLSTELLYVENSGCFFSFLQKMMGLHTTCLFAIFSRQWAMSKKDIHTVLRADVPCFIPSFHCPARDQETDNDATSKNPLKEENNRKGKSGRRRRRGKKQTPNEVGSGNERSTEHSRRNNNADRRNQQKGIHVHPNKGISNHQITSSEDQSKKPSQQRHPANHRKTQQQEHGRGRGNRRHRRPKGEQHDISETDNTSGHQLVLPLSEESSFPSLVASRTTTVSKSIHDGDDDDDDDDDDASTNKVWLSSRNAPELFQPPIQQDSSTQMEDDYSSTMGLQLLTSQNSNQVKQRVESVAYEPPENGLVSQNAQGENQEKDVGDPQDALQQRIRSRRPKVSMDRLRDRWWDALAHRRLQRDLLTELQHALEDRGVVEPDPSYEPFSEDESSLSVASDTESSSDTQDEHPTSALQMLVERSSSDGIMSKTCFDIIRRAIERNEEEALEEILLLCSGELPSLPSGFRVEDLRWDEEAAEQAMHLSVQHNRPHLLQIILSHSADIGNPSDRKNKEGNTKKVSNQVGPLMLAAELGHEECLSLLLLKQDLSSKDAWGNNVFHYCCRGEGDESILRLLLKQISGGTKGKQQQQSKLLLAKNDLLQTPLHIACEQGRVDLVETFLAMCSSALLSKLLAMEDNRNQTPLLAAVAANATDVVMCLIMWRGNHNLVLRKTSQAPRKYVVSVPENTAGFDKSSESGLPSCPLVWATKHGNLDMMLLLLQFSDPSGSVYRITEAISVILRSDAACDIKSEGVQVLVQDGGNPFLEVVPFDGTGEPETAISVAAKCAPTIVLRTLIAAGKRELENRQLSRRRDPKLRQPEMFFEAMESKENTDMKRAIHNALVESLFRGWNASKYSEQQMSLHLASAVTLYNLGAQLEERGLLRLRSSMQAGKLRSELPFNKSQESHCFAATYQHHGGPTDDFSKLSDVNKSPLAYGSKLLYQMSWMDQEMERTACSCPWLSDNWRNSRVLNENVPNEEIIVLIADDGTRFVVHGSIVSQKSAKIASAVRFAKMNQSFGHNKPPEIQVAVEPRLCKLMLQHFYHGSISCGWSRGREQSCRDILELMLVAEEFLCLSLIQECEMRLLSTDPTRCFCWSCAKAVRCLSGKDRLSECMYCVDGSCSLLTGTSVLDVLAVVQHMESLDLKYGIRVIPIPLTSLTCMQSSRAWANHDNRWKIIKAVCSLKDHAIAVILNNFAEVVKSGSFQESAELNEASQLDSLAYDMSHQASLLLQMCLEELATSHLPNNLLQK
jgi:ankyrin repeat protein